MNRLIFLLTFTLTITIFSHNGNTAPVTDGLVSYWTFDDQDITGDIVKDVWGENDGTIVGNPKIVGGRVRGGLKFDGSDDYVNLTNLGDFGSQLASSTFEAWVKTSPKKNYMTLFDVIDVGCSMGWGIHLNGKMNNNNIVFAEDFIHCYIGYKTGENECFASSSARLLPIVDRKWHHVVYIYELYMDEIGHEWRKKSIYVDDKWYSLGLFDVSKFDTFIPFKTPVYLGAANNHGKAEGFFNGVIDEVRIYNRGLTADEVAQNFESKVGLSVEAAEKLPVLWGNLKTAQ